MVWGWFRGKKAEEVEARPDPARAANLFAKVAQDKKPPPTLPTVPGACVHGGPSLGGVRGGQLRGRRCCWRGAVRLGSFRVCGAGHC